MKCGALQRAVGKQHAIARDDADQHAGEACETRDQRDAVAGFELVELRTVDDPGNDFARVDLLAKVHRRDKLELLGRIEGFNRLRPVDGALRRPVEVGDRSPRERKRMGIVTRQPVRDARDAGVKVSAAKVFGAHRLSGRRLDQGWPAQKDRALLVDDDCLVRHRRHIGAARGAGPHHHRDLRDPGRRHTRLVEEDSPEMVAVGKNLSLVRQIGPA